MSKDKQILIIYLFLCVTTVLVFCQVGNHEFLNFDDNVYITANDYVLKGITARGLSWAFTSFGYAANWHPLTWISHMLDVQLFGLNPHWHHLTNLLFHITNVLLLFFLFHRMTKALLPSAFVAALFALHPLHVESVAWIAERKDVLSTLFWMLTLIAYVYYAERPRLKSYLVVVALFALGLMAKPMLVTLPFVLLLLDYWPLGRLAEDTTIQSVPTDANSPISVRKRKGKTAKPIPKTVVEIEKPADHQFRRAAIRPLVLEKIPLFVLTILSCAATYIAQREGGAVAPSEFYALDMRVGNAFVSYSTYLIKTIWPDSLAVLYPHTSVLPLWQVFGATLFLVAVTVAVIVRAKRFPYLPVGWLWFTGTLFPVIGIVQVGDQAMADRYTYIPLIGLFIIAAWGIPGILKGRRYGKEILVASSALCLLSLFVLTWTQVGYWRDSITLYDHALNVTKDNWTIYYNRGNANYALGHHARAAEDFDRTIQINPGYAKAYYSRGIYYQSIGKYREAIEDFEKAVVIYPKYVDAHFQQGLAYSEIGDLPQAIKEFSMVIELNPNIAAYFRRGISYLILGDLSKAIIDFDKAIEIDPGYANAYLNRGIAYARHGDLTQAINDLDKAIAINPGYSNAYFNRGLACETLGRKSQAIEDINTAARLGSEDARKFLKNQGAGWYPPIERPS